MNRKILSSNGYDLFEQGDTAQELADKTLSAFFGRKVEVQYKSVPLGKQKNYLW